MPHCPGLGRASPGLHETTAQPFALEAYLSIQDLYHSIYNLVKYDGIETWDYQRFPEGDADVSGLYCDNVGPAPR
jgi:hypothetical protein